MNTHTVTRITVEDIIADAKRKSRAAWEAWRANYRGAGCAPVNECYKWANGFLFPGSMILHVTRCRYALLARMARAAGDLLARDVGNLGRRLRILASWGLVRFVKSLRRWELTADGWKLVTDCENAWSLANDPAFVEV